MQKLFDDNIILIEDVHKYQLKDDPQFEFTSCTAFAKYFFKTFDKIGIANKLTGTHPNYTHLTPQELVENWDEIAAEGTLIHQEIENFINDRSEPTHPKSKYAAEWLNANILNKNKYKIYSEVIIYSKELKLAGTIDVLIYDESKNIYKILDWKTNRKIDTQSYNGEVGNHDASSTLMDCNYYHYSVQLSLYRYILEKYYGLKVTGTAISHLTNYDLILYKTEYHKNEIKKMFLADREELKKKSEDSLTTEFDL